MCIPIHKHVTVLTSSCQKIITAVRLRQCFYQYYFDRNHITPAADDRQMRIAVILWMRQEGVTFMTSWRILTLLEDLAHVRNAMLTLHINLHIWQLCYFEVFAGIYEYIKVW